MIKVAVAGKRLTIAVGCLALMHASLLPAGTSAAEERAATSTSVEDLPATVRTVLRHRNLPADTLSIYVFNLDEGEDVLAFNADTPRNPASVMKLVTTLVALDVLGPAYRWRTEAWLRGELDGEVLDGDLLLKGYGDPFLVTERVWTMLRGMRRQGLRRIDGDLLLDDSYFDVGDEDPAAFDRQPLRSYNVLPNALMMNFKVVSYYFEPEPDASAVRIRFDPELDNLKIVNRLSVSKGRCGGYQRGIAIIPNDSFDEFTFSGRFPSGCNLYSMTRSALDHNEYTYGLFREIWHSVGGEFEGGWRNISFDPGPEDEPWFSFDSWPLADVASYVNKYSNNVMARHLLLTVAAETRGAPGTVEKGRSAVVEWMNERGIDARGFEITNGSGLSRDGRISARQMVGLLAHAYRQPYMPEFLSSMSLTGLDGTTSRRFDASDPLAGRAHVKTGSLDHVSAIAGYVHARSGTRYAVVTLQNHTDVHRGYGEEIQEMLLRWVYAR